MQDKDEENYRKHLRMTVDIFEFLLRSLITKQTTAMRRPVSSEEQLKITLRFLATGEPYISLMYQYRVNETCIARIIPCVCEGIITTLMDEYMSFPETPEEWRTIAERYENT